MKFKLGKYYKHTTDHWLHICGIADTIMWGRTFIAEQAGRDRKEFSGNRCQELMAVGNDENSAFNYHEVSEEDFVKHNYS